MAKVTYKRKVYEVVAEQWNGEVNNGVVAYYMGKTYADLMKSEPVGGRLKPEGIDLKVGDYIIYGEGGRYVVPKRTFEETYELAGEEVSSESPSTHPGN